jgi:hypothetical protein
VLSGRGPCDGLITVQRSPIECGVVNECDLEALFRGGPDPKQGRNATRKKYYLCIQGPLHPALSNFGAYVPPKRRYLQPNTSGHIINEHSINYGL